MAPEIAGVLVVLDLRFESGQLSGSVDEVEIQAGQSFDDTLRVRWNTVPESQHYRSLANGVVYVSTRNSPHIFHAESAQIDSFGPGNYAWIHFARKTGLMFVLVLPEGYTVGKSRPLPRSAKVFKNRIALYFRPQMQGDAGARVTWELKKVEGTTEAEVEKINKEAIEAESSLPKSGVQVEDRPGQGLSGLAYLLFALLMLIVGVGLLLFYVNQVPKLIENGVENRVFYFLLFPWGLSAAAFLFGAMRSYARYTHKGVPASFELGGPAAFFFIVVFLGYQMVQNASSPFDLTVRAHSADNTVPLIKAGKITVELGSALRTEDIGPNGEANFKGLLSSFKGKSVRILPVVDGYRSEWQTQKLGSDVVDLALEKAPAPVIRFLGSIVPPPKNWKTITVRVAGSQTAGKVDELGGFDFTVEGKAGDRIRLNIYDGTDLVYDDFQTLPGPVTLALRHGARLTISPPSNPAGTASTSKSGFDGTWQVLVTGDISNARIRSGTFDIAAQDDGSLLVNGNYRSDGMNVSCRGIGSVAGAELFVEYTATTPDGGKWTGKGKLRLNNASELSGEWDSKAGDSFPVRARRLR